MIEQSPPRRGGNGHGLPWAFRPGDMWLYDWLMSARLTWYRTTRAVSPAERAVHDEQVE
jgi:hypothetical protein